MGILGLENVPGLGGLEGVDVLSLAGGLGAIILGFSVFILIGGTILILLYRRNQTKLYNISIHFFEEVRGIVTPVEDFKARELIIPNSNIAVFYIKSKKLYLPRGNIKTGDKAYWYFIRKNRELVNFTMTNLNEEMNKANLDYDHSDMRYSQSNLQALIQRNYKDNATPWWREYKDIISVILLVFVMTLGFIFIISQLGKVVGQVGTLIDSAEQVIRAADATKGSGVVPA